MMNWKRLPLRWIEQRIQDVLLPEETLDWNNYSRTPFPHQVLGTRWILGLALDSEGLGGGLLADDMGLGKTFMSLASMDHLYQSLSA
jgi:SNF2 family DNA or RNA helicase